MSSRGAQRRSDLDAERATLQGFDHGIRPFLVARRFFVYLLTNQTRTVLYVGVTNSLRARLWQHRNGLGSHFVARYRVDRLVYVEEFSDAMSAIRREKQLKAGSRQRKMALIEAVNPQWSDLADDL